MKASPRSRAGCRTRMPTVDCPAVGTILKGPDFKKLRSVSSLQECYERCEEAWQCIAWSYRASNKQCRLKRRLKKVQRNRKFTSGGKYCDPSEVESSTAVVTTPATRETTTQSSTARTITPTGGITVITLREGLKDNLQKY